MNIGEILYFSPSRKFSELDQLDSERLIEAFHERATCYYINPARCLLESHVDTSAFAVGILCFSALDFVTRYSIGRRKDRLTKWLEEIHPEIVQDKRVQVPNWVRHGIIHEGRIKEAGYFSFDYGNAIGIEEGLVVVNPERLIKEVCETLQGYYSELKSSNTKANKLLCELRSDFAKEIKGAKA